MGSGFLKSGEFWFMLYLFYCVCWVVVVSGWLYFGCFGIVVENRLYW